VTKKALLTVVVLDECVGGKTCRMYVGESTETVLHLEEG
jgi:hypothetical protein